MKGVHMQYGIVYLEKIRQILDKIEQEQGKNIIAAAEIMSDSIAKGGLVHVFGSGHSVIPALDIFPRYGSFPGFHPLLDPRLMWFNVLGPGGVRELLWLERKEGYAQIFLANYCLLKTDVMLVFSHGGLNAAPVEVAMEAKRRGLAVIAVTSLENYHRSQAVHSSGKRLADLADVVIDNCVPPEDALIRIDGLEEPVAAGSTLAAVAIAMALVSEVARRLVQMDIKPRVFVSPNVDKEAIQHNEQVFAVYQQMLKHRR
jgi:uncharacterized phosphosugar-binding protein